MAAFTHEAAKEYTTIINNNDEDFGSYGADINLWNFYNLLTGAVKSSYIDPFLDRMVNASDVALGINAVLNNTDDKYRWFIE